VGPTHYEEARDGTLEDDIPLSHRQLLHTIVLIQVMFRSGSIILLACRVVDYNSDSQYTSKRRQLLMIAGRENDCSCQYSMSIFASMIATCSLSGVKESQTRLGGLQVCRVLIQDATQSCM
jgi:hypothetical protein